MEKKIPGMNVPDLVNQQWSKRRKQRNPTAEKVKVATWIKAAGDLFAEMQDKTTGWFSAQTRDDYTRKLTALYDQKDALYSRFKGDEKATHTIDAIVEDLEKARQTIEHNGNYYSQWGSQEEYNQWQYFYNGDQDTRIKNATANLKKKTKAKDNAYGQYKSHLNADVDDIDFMTHDSDAAEKKGQKLLGVYQQAEAEEKKAWEILWDAKYDTMTSAELQAIMEGVQDKAEKDHVSKLQKNANLAERKQELADLSAVVDPESEQYDPDFLAKSDYRSTAVNDGSLGESDTGYADIDYEFINGNEDISELIVGMDRNYYQITDEERQIYNYWYNYDREHGTDKAKRYLNLLQETFNARDSEADYAKIEGKALQEILYGVKSGLAKFGRDIDTLYRQPEDYIPMTSTEMTAQKAYEGLGDVGNVRWYNMKTGQWEDKIAGKSLGQLGFNAVEDAAYNLPGTIAGTLVDPLKIPVAKAVLQGVISGAANNGDAYRQMMKQGYTPEQAREYGNRVGIGTGVIETASSLLQDQAKKQIEATISSGPARALGKLLTNNDWLGITESLQSIVEDNALKAVTGEDKPGTEQLQAAAQSAVAAKAMDKIFNQMKADPEALSLDLRQSLLQALKDPATRQAIEKTGTFTPGQLDTIAAGLENAGDQDEGIGTYVGDILYGPTGFAINKQELIPLAEEAFHNRGNYDNDPTARALYERYMR